MNRLSSLLVKASIVMCDIAVKREIKQLRKHGQENTDKTEEKLYKRERTLEVLVRLIVPVSLLAITLILMFMLMSVSNNLIEAGTTEL